MKYGFMQRYRNEFSVERMSKVLGVSRSGYYAFVKATPSERDRANKKLTEKIKIIHEGSRQTYGSPRIHAELVEGGTPCSRKRVARLMRREGIQAKMRKRFKVTTRVNPKAEAAPNLLQQDFSAFKANKRWVADITYVATMEGWLYVAAVMDLFSRRIVGLAMSSRMTADLVTDAVKQAITHRRPEAGLLHHSDRGCQYTSLSFQQLLKINEITVSMSGTGNCFDNAAMESFFHTLKTEHIYFEWYHTREEAKQSIFEYVEVFYNRRRRHSTLGYTAPAIFEERALKVA
jgi:transposase InsO family protein